MRAVGVALAKIGYQLSPVEEAGRVFRGSLIFGIVSQFEMLEATGRPSSADWCGLEAKTLVSKTRPVAPDSN